MKDCKAAYIDFEFFGSDEGQKNMRKKTNCLGRRHPNENIFWREESLMTFDPEGAVPLKSKIEFRAQTPAGYTPDDRSDTSPTYQVRMLSECYNL
jgi:hypothetical protein